MCPWPEDVDPLVSGRTVALSRCAYSRDGNQRAHHMWKVLLEALVRSTELQMRNVYSPTDECARIF